MGELLLPYRHPQPCRIVPVGRHACPAGRAMHS